MTHVLSGSKAGDLAHLGRITIEQIKDSKNVDLRYWTQMNDSSHEESWKRNAMGKTPIQSSLSPNVQPVKTKRGSVLATMKGGGNELFTDAQR